MPTFSESFGRVLNNQRMLMQMGVEREKLADLKQQREAQAQKQMRIRELMQEEGQQAKPLTRYGTDPAPLLQTGNSYINAGRQIAAEDPKAGAELIKQGDEILTVANKRGAEELKQQQEVLAHVVGWSSTVDSQPALEQARQSVEARHPGTWAAMKLPTEYNENTAQIFKRLNQASTTALQQADLQIKQMKLVEEKKYYQARTEKEIALANKARRDAAREQTGLPRTTKTRDPIALYENKILAESQLYEKEKSGVLKDTKKYSTREKETGRLWWKETQPSAQAQALGAVEKAHQGRLAAINRWANVQGIPISREAPAPAVAYLRANNTPEVRQAFEEKYGYLPD